MKKKGEKTMEKSKTIIYATLPAGWTIIKGATTAPRGYVWISNGQSRFSGDYKHALLKL